MKSMLSAGKRRTASFALTAVVCFIGEAKAQQAASPDSGLEEITVTAQRRSESIQRTPVAVTAFGAEEIEQRAIHATTDIGYNSPGLTTVSVAGTVSGGDWTIRGIGQDSISIAFDPGVGFYIDDVYIARTTFTNRSLFDLQRVEILRGPQGTLYGRNSSGGAVKLYTQQPSTDAVTVDGEAFYGNYDRYEVSSGVNVPVSDDLAVRVTASRSGEERGYLFNTTLQKRVSTSDNDYVHGVLAWTPDDRFSVSASIDYNRLDSDGAYYSSTPSDWPKSLQYTSSPLSLYDNAREYGASINASYAFTDDIKLRSITAYRQSTVALDLDVSNSGIEIVADTHNEQVTQELQLLGSSFGDRLKWTAGFFYFHEIGREAWIVGLPLAGVYFQKTYSNVSTDAEALYAQATYAIVPTVRLTLGGRYSIEDKSLGVNSLATAGSAAYDTASIRALGIPTDISAYRLTPRIGLDVDVMDGVLAYFTYNKGFKGGGFNNQQATAAASLPFRPELVEAYEVGTKAKWFDNHLQTNLALYDEDLSQAQFSFFVPGTTQVAQGNVGSAAIQGVEFETRARITPEFDAFGYVDYTYNSISDVAPGAVAAGIRPGNSLKEVPKWKYQLGLNYSVPSPLIEGTLTMRGTWSWETSSWVSPANTPDQRLPSHGRFDASIRYDSPSGRYYVQLEGQNLSSVRVPVNRLDAIGVIEQPNFPAWFGIRVGGHF